MKKSTKKNISGVVYWAVAVILSAFFLFPILILLLRSVMPNEEVMSYPVKVFPSKPYFGSYAAAFNADLLQYLLNTVIVIGANVVIIPVMSSLCAYGFAKLKIHGKEILFGAVLATMMMPAISMQIPLYNIYLNLGLVNSLWSLILPALFGGGAINIFLLRQFMRGIPNEIDNAARLDGANVLRIWFTMYLPLCKPILLYVVVSTFLGLWNDFMGPLIYLNDPEKYTLAVGIYNKYVGQLNSENLPNIQMATGVLLLLPCAVIFFCFQKQLIGGIAVGSVKG